MSGGHFGYKQYVLDDIADAIKRIVSNNSSNELNQYGDRIGSHYSDEVISKLKETIHWVERSREMVQRVDWLLSGDDSETSFLQRWEEAVRKP